MENYLRHCRNDSSLVIFKAEVLDNVGGDRSLDDDAVCQVGFCPEPPKITRGRRKGQPNWKKRDRSKEGTAVITRQQLKKWMCEWHLKTGLCPHCFGDRQLVVGVSVDKGARYKPCGYCQ